MKKMILVGLIVLGAMPVFAQEAGRVPDMIQNATHHFQVANPEKWNAKKTKTDNTILLISPKQEAGDQFLENVSVYAENLSYSSEKTLESCRDKVLKSLEQSIQELQIRQKDETVLDGQPAYEIIYVGQAKGRSMKWKAIITIKDDHVYVLTYTADEKDYFKQLESANKILYSFKFI